VLGPAPCNPHLFEGVPHRLNTQGAGGHALLKANLGQQAKRPQTGVLAKRTRTFVHDRPKLFAFGFVEHGCDTFGARRFGSQAGRHVNSVRTNRVAHGLCRTSEVRRDLGGTLAARAGKPDLAAS